MVRVEFVALLVTVMPAPFTAPGVAGANATVRVAVCPGVSTVPLGMPLAVNPAPATVTPEMVMLEFPLLVIAVVKDALLPSFTFPKLKVVGLAASSRAAVAPVPDRLITREEGAPFVASVMLPPTAVEEDGVKTALNVVLPPAVIVVDVERPVSLKPAPATVICENVSVALPLFASVIVCELLVPTVTVPKVTLVGLAAICGSVPVPVSAIERGGPGALLVIDTLPLVLVAVVGAKVTEKFAVTPAAIDCPEPIPLVLKPDPVMDAWEMLTDVVPVFVTLTVCVAALPTATFPKLRLLALDERTPADGCAGSPVVAPDAAVVYPAQLESAKLATTTNTTASRLPLPLPQRTS